MLTQADVRTAVERAIGFFENSSEPHALLWLNVMHRKFKVEQFADSLERFDRILAEGREDAPVLRVLRRIADANNPLDPDDLDHVNEQTDRLLISALYCDQYGLPPTFAEALEKAVREGGYAVTHGLLALIWIRENRCNFELPEGFDDRMYDRVAAIVDDQPGMVNDLKLEAAAFLCLARQAKRVDLRFVQHVVAIQNEDGGWGRPPDTDKDAHPDGSSWHSSILALLLLLHVHFP